MTNKHQVWFGFAGALVLTGSILGCAGADGAAGATGATGAAGTNGTNGTNGQDGAKGATGAAGTNGATGATGATGAAAPLPTASVALVTPDRLVAGRTTKVTVLAVGTTFTAATTLDFGAGITATTPRILSSVSLETTVTVTAAAALGARTLAVTTGAQSVSQPNAFTVDAPVTAVGAPGVLAQGAEGAFRVRTTAPRAFSATVSGTNLVVGNATFTSPAGITLGTPVKWLSAEVAEVPYTISPFFAAGAAAITVNYAEGGTDAASVDVAASAPTAITAGTPATGNIALGGGVAVFTYAAAANVAANLTFAPGSTAFNPRIRVFTAGNDAALTTITGTTVGFRPATATTYTIVVSDATPAATNAAVSVTATVATLGTEVEPNESRTATPTPLVWGTPLVGTIGTTDKDYYSFTVGGTAPVVVEARLTQFGTVSGARKVYFCLDTAAACTATADSRTNNSGYDANSGRAAGAPQVMSALLPPGNWFVAVEANTSTQTNSDYTISVVQKTVTEEVEPNDTAATATVLPLGNIGKGARAATSENPVDFWKVNLTAGNYFIQTRPWIATDATNGNFDTQVWICNENTALNTSSCTYLLVPTGAYNDDNGPWLYSEWTYNAATAGAYFIGVQSYNQSTSIGNYLLTVDKQ